MSFTVHRPSKNSRFENTLVESHKSAEIMISTIRRIETKYYLKQFLRELTIPNSPYISKNSYLINIIVRINFQDNFEDDD